MHLTPWEQNVKMEAMTRNGSLSKGSKNSLQDSKSPFEMNLVFGKRRAMNIVTFTNS